MIYVDEPKRKRKDTEFIVQWSKAVVYPRSIEDEWGDSTSLEDYDERMMGDPAYWANVGPD